jgi:hypothetical protein
MMHGTVNLDKLCRLLEKIATEENRGSIVTIKIIPDEKQLQQTNKTA